MSRSDLQRVGAITEADDGVGLVLMRADPWMWVLTLRMHPEHGERFGPGAGLLIERLGDDIRRAFAISYGLGTYLQPGREAIEESWDRLPVAAALIDLDLKTRATNSAADDLFASRRYFLPMAQGKSAKGAGLTAANADSRELLARNVDRVISGASDREVFVIHGLRGAARLPVVLLAIGRMREWDRFRATPGKPADCAVAFFGEPDVLSARMPDRVSA